MNIQDEVRRALQPSIVQGLVQGVGGMVFAGYDGVPSPGQHPTVLVVVNADNPEAHRVDITKPALQAGLKVELSLQPNPSRSRG
jgi:hypothetical protein